MAASWNRYQKLIHHHIHGFSVTRGGSVIESTVRQFRSAREGINFNGGGEASERSRPINRNSPQNNRSNFRQETMREYTSDGKSFDHSGDEAPGRSTSHIMNGNDDRGEVRMGNDKPGNSFLDKIKLSFYKNSDDAKSPIQGGETISNKKEKTADEEAEQLFKRMKESGLVPNAVAYLDVIRKEGKVQETMDFIRLRGKEGTTPEVVIYTILVAGFCKTHKVDDAKRTFWKMRSVGLVPDGFSYSVLVQGLCSCGRVEDAVEYCKEMIDVGYCPNVGAFVGLMSGIYSKEKNTERGVEEAKKMVKRILQKGLVINEKALWEFLDNNGPFSLHLWEAILGKKPSSTSSTRS